MALDPVFLHLDHFNLHCPATGIKITSEDSEVQSSPALLFCYLHEIEDFEFITDSLRLLYEKIKKDKDKKGVEDDAESESTYELFIKSIANDEEKILLSISLTGADPSSVDYCFDMNYSGR